MYLCKSVTKRGFFFFKISNIFIIKLTFLIYKTYKELFVSVCKARQFTRSNRVINPYCSTFTYNQVMFNESIKYNICTTRTVLKCLKFNLRQLVGEIFDCAIEALN